MPRIVRLSPAALRGAFPDPAGAALLLALVAACFGLRVAVAGPDAVRQALDTFREARADAAVRFRWEQAAALGVHWATLGAIPLLLAALATMRWWARPADAQPEEPDTAPRGRRYAPALLGICLLAAAVRLPLATGSLWWDEVWNVKYATVGEWRDGRAHPGELRFYPSGWGRAAWYYNKPANHPVMTLPSRASHLVWQRIAGAGPGGFSELAIRMPVLLAGLGALLLAAAVARRLCGDAAGLLTALLLAIHPWAIRYGVDARSYGMSMLFAAIGLYSLVRISRDPAGAPMKWWWWFALAQFGLMWGHVLANLSVCFALFVAAAVTIFPQRVDLRDRLRTGVRLTAVNVVAAAALPVAFLPNLLQAMTWHERNDDGNRPDAAYLLRTVSQVMTGMEPAGAVQGVPALAPAAGIALGIALSAALAAGVMFVARRRPASLPALLAIPAGSLLFVVGIVVTGFYFYHRFLVPVAVPLAVAAGIGLARFPRSLALAVVVGFVAIVRPQIGLLTTRSYAPMREVADALRNGPGSGDGRAVAVGYGLGGDMIQAYYPAVVPVLGRGDVSLESCIAKADAEGRPLLVAWGYDALNRQNLPDGFRLLDDPSVFAPVGEFHGIDPDFTFRVVRLLRPDSPP